MSCKNDLKCFTLTWKIENFSLFLSPVLYLRSPVWKTESPEGNALWQVHVQLTDSKLRFFPINLSAENKCNLSQYEMSFFTPCGGIPMTEENNTDSYTSCFSVEKSAIFGITGSSILPEDTMTLCFKIRQQAIMSGQCLLQTVLHKVNFIWSIEGLSFDSDFRKRKLHQHETLLFISRIGKSKHMGTHKVQLEVIPNYGISSTFMSCEINIKDDRGRVLSNAMHFPCVSWSWVLEIFSGSSDSLHLEIESAVAVDTEYPQLTTHPKSVPGSSNTLSDDLLLLFKEGLHSDATLNTEGKSFSAHRGILAARSPVFRAMFQKDEMKEGQSGVVDIDDVDSATVDRLLVFLYGGSLDDDVQWKDASMLYYAADKYAVLPLKQKCSDILMASVSVDNACDLLVLADTHSDQELKKCVMDFICLHEEVVSSPKWDALEEENSRLTSKIWRELFFKCKRGH